MRGETGAKLMVTTETQPVQSVGDTMTLRQRRQAMTAVTLGNGLEFYDFITYAFFAIQIGQAFFPSESPYLSLMGSLAAFGAGFVTRPLGAWVLGGYGDRQGRKPAMLISMLLMGLGIAILVLTPGYATIGYLAPALAIVARLIQGFALGGEVGSASVFMLECAPTHRRGYSMSWQGVSQNVAGAFGAFVGLGLALTLTPVELANWGWRVALGLGVAIVPIALYMRSRLPETYAAAKQERPARTPLKPYIRPIACGFAMISSGTMASYVFIYMATYAQNTLKMPSSTAFTGELLNNLSQALAIVAGGILSDRIGRRPVMVWAQVLFVLSILPCFWWITNGGGVAAFYFANLYLAGLSAFYFGAVFALIAEGLPPQIRTRVFALVYAVPVAVFGGTTQLQVTWLLEVTGEPVALGWYLTGTALIGLVAAIVAHETAPGRAAIPQPLPA